MVKETFARNKPGYADSPPPGESLASISVVLDTGALDTFLCTFTGQPGSTFYAMVYTTAPMSSGVMSPRKSAFRLIASQTVPTTPFQIELKTQYEATFGIPGKPGKIFAKCILIDTDTGQPFGAGQVSTIVTEV